MEEHYKARVGKFDLRLAGLWKAIQACDRHLREQLLDIESRIKRRRASLTLSDQPSEGSLQSQPCCRSCWNAP